MAKKRLTKKRATKKSRSKGKRRTGKKFGSKPEKKSRLPELEVQYNQLMALTQDSQTPQIRENARVLGERMAQFKAGEIKAEQVKATIDIQMETIQALAAMTPSAATTPSATTTPSGDRTPNLHETDLALKLLEIGLKLLL
jgi:hypothetical protein